MLGDVVAADTNGRNSNADAAANTKVVVAATKLAEDDSGWNRRERCKPCCTNDGQRYECCDH